jgi:hypothetical protein
MSPLQQRIAIVSESTANLIAQLRELDLLRERIRKAQLSVKKRAASEISPRVSPEPAEREPARSGPPESMAAALERTALG